MGGRQHRRAAKREVGSGGAGGKEAGKTAAMARRLASLTGVGRLLAVLLLVMTLAAPAAHAFTLPGRRPATPEDPGRLPARSRLQEVAPPPAVQQLQEALQGHTPRLEILSPADGTLLPAGPWTLQLRVEDWPLVDAGPLGLGPHLVVQLDGAPPLPLTGTSLRMPPLDPGSHRLTVYAAKPWGEAVKSPGAQRQIRLHRAAANPLGQPAPGSPQLIAVSPLGLQAATPLLLDWLLLDAPLQNLRQGDASWRLRVSIDGDSFLLDQQTPLWLEGWRPGSNPIQLELLDGIGEPLNPPFNSLVTEVSLEPGAAVPRWQGGRLDPAELASLLGEAPPPAPEPPEPPAALQEEVSPGVEEAPALGPAASQEKDSGSTPEPDGPGSVAAEAAGPETPVAADAGPVPGTDAPLPGENDGPTAGPPGPDADAGDAAAVADTAAGMPSPEPAGTPPGATAAAPADEASEGTSATDRSPAP